jgi:ADP-heptose:LPS heptosyltransferase
MHLAAAVGAPVVALFGSTNPEWTAPRGPSHAVVRHHVACSPCYRRACPIGLLCFVGISVDAVWAAVRERLDATP